eukprot:TRINITY_DN26530_c0_g1_i2.p1 TRINITY_DN26530_c0_g1~~TRINITY_DN26530_c0_g1_i2.p1  ORF type:complete len:452 (+),score=149.01 TRINITY_DN26530_c0_g1_i2:128-1483(+)
MACVPLPPHGEVQYGGALPDAVLLNRRAAFDIFDVAHDGTINAFELPAALMACDDVRSEVNAHVARQLREGEVQSALDRVGAELGGVITFQQFAEICDILVHNYADRRKAEEMRAELRARDEEEDIVLARLGAPESPRGPRALLWSDEEHPELGPVQRAFYAFDVDNSGLVSGHEVPRMLRLVGIGPKRDDDWRGAYQRKWMDALASIWPPKEPHELLNVHDFHDLCMLLKPDTERELPERPRPPTPASPCSPETAEEPSPEDLARMEKERLEAELLERERQRKATLHFQLPDGGLFQLPECKSSDKVGDLMRRLEEDTGIPVQSQRLVCQGYEMSPLETLESYKIKTGNPVQDRAHVVTMLLRQQRGEDPPKQQYGPVHIRSQTGDYWQVLAKDDDTIGDISQRVQDLTGIPVAVQRLVGNGRELAPWERLRDADLSRGDTLVMLLRPAA